MKKRSSTLALSLICSFLQQTHKQTIIECLKYATTGIFPPNAARGQAWIHDPKIAGEREVKAQVKLRFKVMDTQYVVTRSLQLVQKQNKLEMKTLDSTVQRKSADGEVRRRRRESCGKES
jgi:DNA repair protein RAD50